MKKLVLLSLIISAPAFSMGNFDSPNQLRKSFNKSMELPRLSPSPRQSPQPTGLTYEEEEKARSEKEEGVRKHQLLMERLYPSNHTKALQDMQQKLYKLYRLTARFKDDAEYSMEAMIRSLSTDQAKSESLGRMLQCVDQLIRDAEHRQKEQKTVSAEQPKEEIKRALQRSQEPKQLYAIYDPRPDVLFVGISLVLIFGVILNTVY